MRTNEEKQKPCITFVFIYMVPNLNCLPFQSKNKRKFQGKGGKDHVKKKILGPLTFY